MQILFKEAAIIDRAEVTRKGKARRKDDARRFRKRKGANGYREREESDKVPRGKRASGNSGAGKAKRTKPNCINPECNEQHYMDQCSMTSFEKKKKLLEEYRKIERRRDVTDRLML